MSGPTNRRFVRSAWTLLAFQFVAAAGATGLAVWAATRVQELVHQRDLLQQRVTELQSRVLGEPTEPAPVPEAAPVPETAPVEPPPPVENVETASPPPPPPPPAAAPPPRPRPRHVRPVRTPVIVRPPVVTYVPPPPPPPPPPPIKVEETRPSPPPPPPPPPPRPRRERPRISITPFFPGINLGPRRPRRDPVPPSGQQQQPQGQQPQPGAAPNRTVGPAGQVQTTTPRRTRPPDPPDPQPPK